MRITSDATLASTDVDKTANTPSIKAYIDNSSEYTGYTGTVLFERRLSTAVNTAGAFQKITLILAVNSLVILAFISLVTLVLFGFCASPASS
jgi:hypothetical protein